MHVSSSTKYGWQHPNFVKYALWSYMMPLFITGLTVGIESLVNQHEDTLLRSGVGKDSCFLSGDGILLYLIVPTTPILITNICFFSLTSWNLCFGFWSSKTEELQRIYSIGKIMVMTGITWISEVISWAITHFYQEYDNQTLMVTDL